MDGFGSLASAETRRGSPPTSRSDEEEALENRLLVLIFSGALLN
jgi:hypothetical protein